MVDEPSLENLEELMREEGVVTQDEPLYRVDPQEKIPVSRATGAMWQSRVDAAEKARKLHVDAWDEVIRYYNNDQSAHRSGEGHPDIARNRYFARRQQVPGIATETENIIFANTQAILPAIYAKNPQVNFTCNIKGKERFVNVMERLVNRLATMRHAPGLNMKVHMRKAVLVAELCNSAWIEVGYTQRTMNEVELIGQLNEAARELEKADTPQKIKEIEGRLMSLEENFTFLNPPGPYVRFKMPHEVLVDPHAQLSDASDAKWIATYDYWPTSLLNARFGKKGEDGRYYSVYEPTHVLTNNTDQTSGAHEDFRSYTQLTEDHSYITHGYRSREEMLAASYTKCVRIWDKITRRIYMYACNDWKWPVWVENDPYNFPNFFNLFHLSFNDTPFGMYARSNPGYILDQQDALNEINDQFRRARLNTKENILFDARLDPEAVTAWLTGAQPNARGVKIPPEATLKDLILEKPNVLMKALPLFDKRPLLEAIDRLSGVSDVLRNAQFKTNTTNLAIENYNSVTNMRLDARVDPIEDFIGVILWHVGWLCARFMSLREVEAVIGAENAAGWEQLPPEELREMFDCEAVGGSTQKPTSAAKKAEALQLTELLGRFAQFAPRTVLTTVLQVMSRAFNEITLPPDVWEQIAEEALRSQQQGNNAVQQEQGNLEQLAQAIDALPPQAKQALGDILARGVPVAEALPQVLQLMQQSGRSM